MRLRMRLWTRGTEGFRSPTEQRKNNSKEFSWLLPVVKVLSIVTTSSTILHRWSNIHFVLKNHFPMDNVQRQQPKGVRKTHTAQHFSFVRLLFPRQKKAQDHHGWYISIMSPPKATGRSRKWHITVGRLVTRSGPFSSLLFSDFPWMHAAASHTSRIFPGFFGCWTTFRGIGAQSFSSVWKPSGSCPVVAESRPSIKGQIQIVRQHER